MFLLFYELTSMIYNLESIEVERMLEEQEKKDVEEFIRLAQKNQVK